MNDAEFLLSVNGYGYRYAQIDLCISDNGITSLEVDCDRMFYCAEMFDKNPSWEKGDMAILRYQVPGVSFLFFVGWTALATRKAYDAQTVFPDVRIHW